MKINQIVHLSEDVAGPKNCWPGYKKTGTQPGTGKNKGKRVNDCEKIKQKGVTEQWEPVSGYDTIYPRAKVIKSKNGKPIGEVYQDTYGWGCFHYKADNGADGMSSKEEALEQLKDMHNEHRQQGVAEGSLNELSSDLLKRSAQVATDKRNQAMDPELHNALGGGYMNPLATHYDNVSQKMDNRAAQVRKKETIQKIASKIASPAVMRKMGMSDMEEGVAENKLPKPYKKWAS